MHGNAVSLGNNNNVGFTWAIGSRPCQASATLSRRHPTQACCEQPTRTATPSTDVTVTLTRCTTRREPVAGSRGMLRFLPRALPQTQMEKGLNPHAVRLPPWAYHAPGRTDACSCLRPQTRRSGHGSLNPLKKVCLFLSMQTSKYSRGRWARGSGWIHS